MRVQLSLHPRISSGQRCAVDMIPAYLLRPQKIAAWINKFCCAFGKWISSEEVKDRLRITTHQSLL